MKKFISSSMQAPSIAELCTGQQGPNLDGQTWSSRSIRLFRFLDLRFAGLPFFWPDPGCPYTISLPYEGRRA